MWDGGAMSSRPARTGARITGATCGVLLLAAVIWIVVTYASQTRYPIPGIGNWNLLVGVGILGLGLLVGVIAIVFLVVDAATKPKAPAPPA